MDYDVEKKADELLEALGKELMKRREKYADMILEGEEVPLYGDFVQKHGHYRNFRRMMILIAVLIMLMGLAIVSVDGVREKVFNYFLSDNPGYTEMTPLEQNVESNALPKVKLEYLPNGYELISSEENEVSGVWKSYGNAEEQFIEFSLCRSDYYSPSVDNDTMKREQVRINVYQAQLFSDEQDCYLVWQAGDYTLSLYGSLDKDTMIKIANHVRLN